jgi:hypothetical protein
MTAFSVIALSAAFGAGGAFLEAYIVARSSALGQALIGLSGAWLGIVVGPVMGFVLYGAVFRKAVSLGEFLLVAGLSLAAGCVAALFVPPPGWWAGIVTIMAAILSSVVIAAFRMPKGLANRR